MLGNVGRKWASVMLMVASGFAGLGYQIVWTQECALWLGHESASVLAVVAAFFGGLSLGAWVLGDRIEKSALPVRWYAACELAIALWGFVLVFAMAPTSALLLRAIGVDPSPVWQWSAAFFGTFLLLLPSTAAMGATLPAMERIAARMEGEGPGIATLYASNTFGAVIGVLTAALWLVPERGLTRSALLCTALNVVCAATALVVFPAAAPPPAEPRPRDPVRARSLTLLLGITGFLGIGYEVLVVRVLSEVTEDTVYTFAVMLAVYLVGSAAGAAAYQRWPAPRTVKRELDESLIGALAAACLLGTVTLFGAEHTKATAQGALGGGVTAAVLAEAVPALLAFGLPTVVMGALFSHLAHSASASGIGLGRALGVNTLGAAVAPVAFGVIALPAIGPKWALLLVSIGYLALAARSAWFRPVVWAPAAVAVLVALVAPPLAFVDVPQGGHVVKYLEGVMAAVSVVEDGGGVSRLRIDNRAQEGSSATQRVDGRQAWLPLLLHPAPRTALFLGLGTGVTSASAAEDTTLKVDAVELLPEVIAVSPLFASSVADGAAARVHVLAADARRYVRASDRDYDVIVADNYHPARSGSGSLYTVEHFQAVRSRLAEGGVFCQWLPLHQLDRETFRSIVKSFMAVHPEGVAMLANNGLDTPVIGLVGRRGPSRLDGAEIRQRLSHVALPDRVHGIGFEDEFAVLGSFIGGPASLRRFSSDAVLNTDDAPIVAYRAPRITYAPDSQPRDRLIGLLHELSVEPGEVMMPGTDANWSRRLAAYWAARNRFIEVGRDVKPSPKVEEMLERVGGQLFGMLRTSPDFRPAYDPLFGMVTALAQSDVDTARTLLTELSRLQPDRDEAVKMLASLNGAAPAADPAQR